MADNPTWALAIEGFEIEQVERSAQGWLIHARSRANEHRCPCCGVVTRRVHSYYQRQVRDLSVDGEAVRLRFTVKRMRCVNAVCQRKTFAESIDPLAGAHQHLTRRFVEALRAIGLALNGEGGARLAQRLHLPTSGDTILKIVRLTPEPMPTPLRALGVDDWAQTKRRIYGTILVDLEAHRVVDLLQGRTADVVCIWLQAHAGIEVVTRDRSTEYARGIAAGAPTCQQVADRWHLLHNVSEALERFLQRVRPSLESLYLATSSALRLSHYDRSRQRWQGDERAAKAAHGRRQRFFDTVQRLKQRGLNIPTGRSAFKSLKNWAAHGPRFGISTVRIPALNVALQRANPASWIHLWRIWQNDGMRVVAMPSNFGARSVSRASRGHIAWSRGGRKRGGTRLCRLPAAPHRSARVTPARSSRLAR